MVKKTKQKRERRHRAHLRVRSRVRGTEQRPRLSVYKSLRFIYAQVIDDVRGTTLAQASSAEVEVKGRAAEAGKSGKDRAAAKAVGEVVAERAKAAGVERVVFDRGGYVYHGRVQAVAEGAREKGLQF
ncbi:MAG TPA: 50S ribosomal protein L18 [Thermoanaerobaculia bacterium]|nr:50S ribosomal protein L18 [Thermoanaerobaculia bacterium]